MLNRILYALFPDLEFAHLRGAAWKAHPDKRSRIAEITRHYLQHGSQAAAMAYARHAFAALDRWKEPRDV